MKASFDINTLNKLMDEKKASDRPFHPIDIIRSYMSSIGANRLGSGAFGVVFSHPDFPNDKVIKLSTTDRHDAYYSFARYCMLPENQNNPHLPKIEQEYSFIGDDDKTVFLHIMEKLDKVSEVRQPDCPSDLYDVTAGTIWRGVHRVIARDYGKFNKQFPDYKTFLLAIRAKINYKHKTDPGSWPLKFSIELYKRHKTLIKTFYDIGTLYSDVACLDLHGGNIMSRSKKGRKVQSGTLVITDPVSETWRGWREKIDPEVVSKNLKKLSRHEFTVTAESDYAVSYSTMQCFGAVDVSFKAEHMGKVKQSKNKIETLFV